MTDPEAPELERVTPHSTGNRAGLFAALGAAGIVALAAIVTLVLVVSLGVINSNGLPSGAAKRALLTARDLATVDGVGIATGRNGQVREHSLRAYVAANPGDSSQTVAPANCADNLEGWMAWKSLDTPAYRGWKTDTIVESTNIVVDSTTKYENGLQEARHFVNVNAATAFMNAQRGWYRSCATTTYASPDDPAHDTAFHFVRIPLHLGLDSVVEGSTNTGAGVPPHLVDVYLRNANIVYVTELVTNSAPQHGLDSVSLAIVKAAAKKLGSLH